MSTKPSPNPKLLAVWRDMTPEQRKRFAALVKTTVGNLRQNVDGRRGISSDLAIRIEKAVARMRFLNTSISRMELNATCGRCEFARACNTKESAS